MSQSTLIILSVILAVIIVVVLASALIKVRTDLATLASALTGVESDHLRPLEPAVKAINEQFDVILSALPGIAAKAKIVASRRPT
jgi:hypothetical protein